MASIKLRRGSGVPSGLTFGEPAFDITNSRLYVGITGGSALVGVAGGGVHSFNGLTGAVTGVTTGVANTFGPLQSFTNGISASGSSFAGSIYVRGSGTGTGTSALRVENSSGTNLIRAYDSGQIVFNTGSITDNDGNVQYGFATTSGFSSGIFITDNFNTNAANAQVAITAYDYGSKYDRGLYVSLNGLENPKAHNKQNGQASAIHANILAGKTTGAIAAYLSTSIVGNGNYTADAVNIVSHGYMQAGVTAQIDNFYGIFSLPQHATTGANTTNFYDIYTSPGSFSSGSTIQNRYALYIANTKQNTVNDWGIYQANSSVQNYYGGLVYFNSGLTATGGTFTNDITVNGVRVGEGGGSVTTNVAVGHSVLNANTTGARNTSIGTQTSFTGVTANDNTAIGYRALYLNTQSNNTAVGSGALDANTTGTENVAVGLDVLGQNTTGQGNVGLGHYTLRDVTTGQFNTALGYAAGYASIGSKSNNTLIGYAAGYLCGGDNNTVIGVGAAARMSGTGASNVIIGDNAGRDTTATVDMAYAHQSILIGGYAKAAAENQVNQIVIGYNLGGDGSNTTVIGNSSTTSTRVFGQLSTNGGLSASGGTLSGQLRLTSGLCASGGVTLSGTLQGVTATFTGNLTAPNIVNSFNGLTGAVTGVTTGTANTFGPLQSFTNGISSAGGTFANSVNFLSGLSATGITLTSGSSVTRIIPTSIRASSGFNITGATVAAPSIYNSVNCPISGNLTLESRSGIIDIDAGLSSKTVTYSTGLRFLGANYDVIPEQTYSTILYGSVASGNTLYLPSSSGTLALSSEVTGLQRVTSFNGLTGAVTGVTTGTSNIFGPLQSFTNGISSAGGTFTADIRVNNHTIGRGGGSIVTNVAFGVLALGANTTGLQNTSLGQNSLFANTVGNNNTAVGRRSLFTVTGGSQNVAVGTSSLNNFTGNRTTGLGFSAAAAVSAGTGGIYIGDSVVGTNNSTNEIVIGTDAIGLGSNTAVIGTSTQTLARINGLVDVPSGISASGGTFSGPVSSSGFILTSAGIKSLTGTTYTFLSSDNGDVLTHNNASGCTLTIPSGLPVGFSVTLIQLNATGRIGFTAASGVTLNVYGGFTGMAGQHASASLVSYASNIYNLSGNLI